jgi:hypothetical protein
LRATIAWSWDLLEPPQRQVLAACSAFRGPFDLPRAEALAGAGTLDAPQDLVLRSLVRRVPGAERFTMLEAGDTGCGPGTLSRGRRIVMAPPRRSRCASRW